MSAAQDVVGYLGATSAAPGDPLVVHAASTVAPTCALDVYRVIGSDAQFVPRLKHVARFDDVPALRHGAGVPAGERLGPSEADTEGCGWPGHVVLDAIPETWESGLYLAQVTLAAEPTGTLGEVGQDAMLVVRPAVPGSRSKTLVQVGIATWNAYHIWRDRNLYIGDVGDLTGRESERLRAHRVSFQRPGVGFAPTHNIPWWPPKACLYVPPFVEWLAGEELDVEWCTGLDLHDGTTALDPYELVVTLGHDEYWSGPQRDAIERFTAGGGNAAFFGGNLAYWQIRFVDDGAVVECHKRGPARLDEDSGELVHGLPLDPHYRDPASHPEHDNADVTVEWWSAPLHRPATTLMGTSMQEGEGVRAGAAWWWENFGGPERPAAGFTVADPGHWIFAGTDLRAGDVFGLEQKLVGYECDGLDVAWEDGLPVPTGRGGAPEGVQILAFADCRDWGEVDYDVEPPQRVPGRGTTAGALGGVVTLVSWRTPGGGTVVTAPVTDWPHALIATREYTRYRSLDDEIAPASPVVQQITRNVLERLGGSRQRAR